MMQTALGIAVMVAIYIVGAAIAFQTGEQKLARHRYECQSCERLDRGEYYCSEYFDKEINYAIGAALWPLAVVGISIWWMVSHIGIWAWRIASGVASMVYRPAQIPNPDNIRRLEQDLGIGQETTPAELRAALETVARRQKGK